MELSGSDILNWITFEGVPIISLPIYIHYEVCIWETPQYSAQYDTYNN